jgi:hypothetical protein
MGDFWWELTVELSDWRLRLVDICKSKTSQKVVGNFMKA